MLFWHKHLLIIFYQHVGSVMPLKSKLYYDEKAVKFTGSVSHSDLDI